MCRFAHSRFGDLAGPKDAAQITLDQRRRRAGHCHRRWWNCEPGRDAANISRWVSSERCELRRKATPLFQPAAELDPSQPVYPVTPVLLPDMYSAFRQRQFKQRTSLLVIVMLLWSQLALASHGACLFGDNAVLATPPAADQSAHCDGAESEVDKPLCQSHCGRADLSFEVTQALSVPAIAPDWRFAWPRLIVASSSQSVPISQLASWHRPTAHPASLLLI